MLTTSASVFMSDCRDVLSHTSIVMPMAMTSAPIPVNKRDMRMATFLFPCSMTVRCPPLTTDEYLKDAECILSPGRPVACPTACSSLCWSFSITITSPNDMTMVSRHLRIMYMPSHINAAANTYMNTNKPMTKPGLYSVVLMPFS